MLGWLLTELVVVLATERLLDKSGAAFACRAAPAWRSLPGAVSNTMSPPGRAVFPTEKFRFITTRPGFIGVIFIEASPVVLDVGRDQPLTSDDHRRAQNPVSEPYHLSLLDLE